MERTYYDYAKRKVEDQINWAEVGKNLTDMLKEESKTREEKKAAIDEASRKFGETLASAPTGEHAGMNQWTLDYAADAQEARLIQDRLLKSGQLKLRDYNIMRQNITDGTKGAFSLVEEYQKEYKEKMERANSSDNANRSQYLEQWFMEQAEGFGNFSKSKLYINPTNYQVSVAMKEYDEKNKVYVMSDNPNKFVTINDMRNRIKSKFNYFDFDKVSNEWVKSLGKYTEYVDQVGGWKMVSDPTLRDRLDPTTKASINEFELSMNNQLKSYIAANPFNTTSLLTENIKTVDGKSFTFTYDEEEANNNKNMILLRSDPVNPQGPGVPDFSTANGKEQEKMAFDWMRQQTLVKLEHQESGRYERPEKTPRQATEGELKRADARKAQANKSNMIANLYSGDDAAVTSAVSFFSGSENVRKVTRTPSGVDVTMIDAKGNELTKSIPFYANNKLIPADEWIRGASRLLIGDDADPEIARKTAIKTKDSAFNQMYSTSSEAKTEESTAPIIQIAPLIVKGNAKKTAETMLGTFKDALGVQYFSQMPIKFSHDNNGNVFIRTPQGAAIATFNVSGDKISAEEIQYSIYQYLDKLPKSGTTGEKSKSGPNYELK